MARPTYSVVIPAYNAERTLGLVLDTVAAQETAPLETIVVDDGSTDHTAEIARAHGARVVTPDHKGYAGGARNFGWDQASGDVVVFVDSDVVPNPGWGEGVTRAAEEFPGAIVGCARTFVADAPWQRVAHLQNETPWIVRGEPREARFVSSYCMIVPRSLQLRFDESYGGEDHLFCVDAMAQGVRLIFDPRFSAAHHHGRGTFTALRRQHERLAYGTRRIGPVQREGVHKAFFSRVPVHYFALIRLPLIYRRLDEDDELRGWFVRYLPRLVIAEWAMGVSAMRYAVKPRPSLRGQSGQGFR